MDQILDRAAAEVERLAFEGIRTLQTHRYPHWLLLLE